MNELTLEEMVWLDVEKYIPLQYVVIPFKDRFIVLTRYGQECGTPQLVSDLADFFKKSYEKELRSPTPIGELSPKRFSLKNIKQPEPELQAMDLQIKEFKL